jgi:tRNA threonylcarbamoyl adenosine modification protein YjeE
LYFSKEIQDFEKYLSLKKKSGSPVLVFLRGDLGVGKTTFVKELFASWGYPEGRVQSPTFLKLLEHPIENVGLCLHLDCYRIEDEEAFDKMALENYLEAKFWFVEWPDIFMEFFSKHESLRKVLGFDEIYFLEFDGIGSVKGQTVKFPS